MRLHLVVSLDEDKAEGKVRQWLEQFFVAEHPVPFVLNVAGPRESKVRGIQKRTRTFLVKVIGNMITEKYLLGWREVLPWAKMHFVDRLMTGEDHVELSKKNA